MGGDRKLGLKAKKIEPTTLTEPETDSAKSRQENLENIKNRKMGKMGAWQINGGGTIGIRILTQAIGMAIRDGAKTKGRSNRARAVSQRGKSKPGRRSDEN